MQGPRERFELRGYSTAGALESFDPWRLVIVGAGICLVVLGVACRPGTTGRRVDDEPERPASA